MRSMMVRVCLFAFIALLCASPLQAATHQTRVGVDLYYNAGTYTEENGRRLELLHVLLPEVHVTHRDGRLRERLIFTSPTHHTTPFSEPGQASSTLLIGVGYTSTNGRYEAGVDDTIINENPPAYGNEFSQTRTQGLSLHLRGDLYERHNGKLRASIDLAPYLRNATIFTLVNPGVRSFESVSVRKATLVNGSLRWINRGSVAFSYGVRYTNRTLLIASFPASSHFPSQTLMIHSSSINPFIGVSHTF